MSLPEVLLWQALRGRPGGLKFRRQHPSGPYVADFYCHEARLVIEVDGAAHGMGNGPVRDGRRDEWFEAREIQVRRIAASDVLGNVEGVVRGIVSQALARLPLHHASHGPPPLAGEEY